jgi:hypothetical protein
MRVGLLFVSLVSSGCVSNGDMLTDVRRSARAESVGYTDVNSICIDYCHHSRESGPYAMIIDGTRYRYPEDSLRLLRAAERLEPSEIENVVAIKGPAAMQRYHTDGRGVILITTRSAKQLAR